MAVTSAQKLEQLCAAENTVWMGILNTTPDSFSDGGCYLNAEKALNQALKLIDQGAKIIDVGGVSTRPGAAEISEQQEWLRIFPVLQLLRKEIPQNILLSVDTSTPKIAFQLAQHNLVNLINDVCACTKSQKIEVNGKISELTTAHIAAQFHLGLCIMHMQKKPQNMQNAPQYVDCVEEVFRFLNERALWASALGVSFISIDPGIGFGKSVIHNLELLAESGLKKLSSTPWPLLMGVSRKRFIPESISNSLWREGLPNFQIAHDLDLSIPEQRDRHTKIWEFHCIKNGAKILRTHTLSRGLNEPERPAS